METIIETLQERTDCTTFLRAIAKTNFSDILDGLGPYTVFAPINAAFENLPAKDLKNLFEDNSKLTDLVSQHVLVGRYTTEGLAPSDEVLNMNNKTLAVEHHNEGWIIGGAKIIEPDIECSNGVVHIVDVVLA